jgi:hypothetical protein
METLKMGLRIVLVIIGLATAFAAIHGLVQGTIYSKGGPYSRDSQPAAFWGSVVVYLFWTGLMAYFAFFRPV